MLAIIPVGSEDPAVTLAVAGRPVIDWTIRRWRTAPGIDHVVLAADEGFETTARVSIARGRDRVSAIRAAVALAGTRAAILLCPSDRPLGPRSVVASLHAELGPGVDAVGAARPVRSTLKRVVDGRIVATVSRDEWRADPDPWLFSRAALVHALEAVTASGVETVDGRGIVLAGDLRVRLVDGDATDLPIRTLADARFAERWLAETDGAMDGFAG